MAYNNSWTVSLQLGLLALEAFAVSRNPADLVKSNIDFVAPEYVTAYEVGYRGVVAGVTIDVNAYYNKYEDFHCK